MTSRRAPAVLDATDGSTDARPRPRRVAYLSWSGYGLYDARTFRMARSAIAAGYEVTVYARWRPGFPVVEERDGYRLIRAPFDWRLLVPGLRSGARRRLAAAMAQAPVERGPTDDPAAPVAPAAPAAAAAGSIGAPRTGQGRPRGPLGPVVRPVRRVVRGVLRRIPRPWTPWWELAKAFPLGPLAWARSLEAVADPADIWHGMWAGSLPALDRLRRRHGGRTIYDSRDIYMASRGFAEVRGPGKAILARLERRWAQHADRVVTVNDAYAGLITRTLRVRPPVVIMNCPEAWRPPTPPPDLIREALGLGPETRIVLYQGGLMSGRGIEQSMDAILAVPGAVLVLLGFGGWWDRLAAQAAVPPYAGRVRLLPAVPPDALLRWTASADVSVMAIQPTTINHRYTTPQKLFESLAAGVPVVAADLPAMAEIMRTHGIGVVCDPTSPAAIAAALDEILTASPADRIALRAHVLEVAHAQFTWETQVGALLGLYRELAGGRG